MSMYECGGCGATIMPCTCWAKRTDEAPEPVVKPLTVNDAYEVGWTMAAIWARRNDLMADIDSPAYIQDRDTALARKRKEK